MNSLRRIQGYMADCRGVLLADGSSGKIVRVETTQPYGRTMVSVWVQGGSDAHLAKVELSAIVGPEPMKPPA